MSLGPSDPSSRLLAPHDWGVPGNGHGHGHADGPGTARSLALLPSEGAQQLESSARAFFDRPPPADYLSDWARRLAQPEQEAERDLHSVVVFRLQAEWLALRTTSLVEITDPHPVHSLPHRSNQVLLGLVNIRGQLRLCVSLHGLLGVGPAPSDFAALLKTGGTGGAAQNPYARMIILEYRSEQWVFAVEEVLGVNRIANAQCRKAPSTFLAASSHIQSVFDWEGRTVGYLDAERVMASLRSHCQ